MADATRMTRSAIAGRAAAALCALALAGCIDTAERYRAYSENVAANGGLRTETAPADAAFGDDDLARNFERIAFFIEYSQDDGELVQRETASTLSRWEAPLKIGLFGGGVRPADRISYRALSRRLADLTGVDMTVTDAADEDIAVYIMTEEERTAFRDVIEEDDDRSKFQILSDWSEQFRYPCVAIVGYGGGRTGAARGVITGALIVIKAELEGVMRESCIHEELTQAMGLMNDHPDVRPSIFNDDEEFALLTKHDEYLLRILYDRRLRPAMTLEEARPLIPEIVRDVRGDDG